MFRTLSETPSLLADIADPMVSWWKRCLPRHRLRSLAEVMEIYCSPIDFDATPTAPVWWACDEAQEGSTWLWEQFVVTDVDLPMPMFRLQRAQAHGFSPQTLLDVIQFDRVARLPRFKIIYLHSFHVFWRDGLPLSGAKQYLTPSLILTIETRALTFQAWLEANRAVDSSGIWPLVGKAFSRPCLCAFVNGGRTNYGIYLGPWNAAAARRALFRRLRAELRLKGKPRRLGDMRAAFGHPATGWPRFSELSEQPIPSTTPGGSAAPPEIH